MTHRQMANYMYVMYGTEFPRQDPADVLRDYAELRASYVNGWKSVNGRSQLQENTTPALTADQILAVFAEGEASPRMEQAKSASRAQSGERVVSKQWLLAMSRPMTLMSGGCGSQCAISHRSPTGCRTRRVVRHDAVHGDLAQYRSSMSTTASNSW